MKKLIILLIVVFCSITWAVTTITYNIPDAYGLKLLNALITQSDAEVRIEIQGHYDPEDPNAERYTVGMRFDTPAHDPNVPNAEFVKKRIEFLADAFKVAHERKEKEDIRRAYQQLTPRVDVNEPSSGNMN